jgi:hypothetical protein
MRSKKQRVISIPSALPKYLSLLWKKESSINAA